MLTINYLKIKIRYNFNYKNSAYESSIIDQKMEPVSFLNVDKYTAISKFQTDLH